MSSINQLFHSRAQHSLALGAFLSQNFSFYYVKNMLHSTYVTYISESMILKSHGDFLLTNTLKLGPHVKSKISLNK